MWESYFWPQTHWDLNNSYILFCINYIQNKNTKFKLTRLLYSLPILDNWFNNINMDFVRLLSMDKEYNMLMTVTNQLSLVDIQLMPCNTTNTTLEIACFFFNNWYYENSLFLEIISFWDKLFVSQFWKELHKQTDIKLKMSLAYYLEIDGVVKHTNKTVNQMLHFTLTINKKDK